MQGDYVEVRILVDLVHTLYLVVLIPGILLIYAVFVHPQISPAELGDNTYSIRNCPREVCLIIGRSRSFRIMGEGVRTPNIAQGKIEGLGRKRLDRSRHAVNYSH